MYLFLYFKCSETASEKGAEGSHLQGIRLPQEKGNVVVFIHANDSNVWFV